MRRQGQLVLAVQTERFIETKSPSKIGQDWPRLGGREKPFSMDQTLTAYKCILSVLVLIHSVKSYHDDEIGYDRGGLMALDAEG